jgi:rubrerythrin
MQTNMSIEEAIRDAIEFETRVRDVYDDAVQEVADEKGRHVLQVLAREEQGHLDYLNSRLKEWQKTGKVTMESLSTALPSRDIIIGKIDEIKDKIKPDESIHHSTEVKVLKRALEVERETSEFYKRMVDELPEEGHELFARFVEIEEGHLAMVQAELDYVSGPGYWFDFREFDLSGG